MRKCPFQLSGKLADLLAESSSALPCYSYLLFQWLYAKMSACPLQAVLSDFEDACNHLDDKDAKREIMLVADSLRLGGAILGQVHQFVSIK